MKPTFELYCDSDTHAQDTAANFARMPGLESVSVAHNGRVVEMHISNAVVAGLAALINLASRLFVRENRKADSDAAVEDRSALPS